MTRESRHLKISQLSEPIEEQMLLDYFRSYGRIQKLEVLKDEPGSAVVSFMDMKTASKALGVDHTVAGHAVKASYYEPGSTGLSTTVIQIHDSDESLLHSRPNGGGGSGPPAPQQPQESRRSSSGQHAGFGNRSYGRGVHSANWSSTGAPSWQDNAAYESLKSVGSGFREPHGRSNGLDCNSQQPRRPLSRLSAGGSSGNFDHGGYKRSSSSGSRKTGGASSSPANSRRSSASHSRSPSPCGSPPSRSLGGRFSIDSRHQHSGFRDDGGRGSSGGSGCSLREQVTIVVRNLPRRSTDSSIKDGLFFTYKKHAKVVSVKVIGSNSDRYALVTFRRASDASKAVAATNGHMFFGSRIVVDMAPLGLDGDDNERRPLEKDIDQYHPKSSRTLYVGNLENRITPEQLKQMFGEFGGVLDVDIKNRETPAPFAFVQFADIISVVKAIHAMEQDGYIGNNKIKVGFGKPLPSPMVWLEELPPHVTEEYLTRKMNFYGTITDVVIDRSIRQALVTYESIEAAQSAVTDMKGRTINSRKVQIDFCSRELHDLFVDRMFRYSKNPRGAGGANNSVCGGPNAMASAPTATTSTAPSGRPLPSGKKSFLDYYASDSYYGQRSNRGTGASFNEYGAIPRDYADERSGSRLSNVGHEPRKARGKSMSPSRLSTGKYPYRHDDLKRHDGSSRGGNFHQARGGRHSRSPPARYGAYVSSRDNNLDKTRPVRPFTRDDSGSRVGTVKKPRTPPDEEYSTERKSGEASLRRQRYRRGTENDGQGGRTQRQKGDGSEDSSTSDEESETSTSRSSSSSSANCGESPRLRELALIDVKPKIHLSTSIQASNTRNTSEPSPLLTMPPSAPLASDNTEMTKLNLERERLLQVLERLAPDEESASLAASATGTTTPATAAKAKLSEVFDLEWVKTTAEQEQRTRRQSTVDIKTEPISPKEPTTESIEVKQEVDDDACEANSLERQQKGRTRKTMESRTSTVGSLELEGGSFAVIRSLDEPDHNLDSKLKSEPLDESTHGSVDVGASIATSSATAAGKSKGGESDSASTKRSSLLASRALGSKMKSIPLEADLVSDLILVDPRTNPPNVQCSKDLPLPNFGSKRHLVRHHHGGGACGKSTADSQPVRKPSGTDTLSQDHGPAKSSKSSSTSMEASGSGRAQQTSMDCSRNCRLDHVHFADQSAAAQRHSMLRQRNSSASEQLSPLISSGGEFSATDSDGALMSPTGCGGGGDASASIRAWPSTTVDIFGEALSPNSGANQSNPVEAAASSTNRSFEERIRALDAKFSALDQMIKGAKERPQQPIRQNLGASSTGGIPNIDYSKYKVVKKPSVCGTSSSPSSTAPVNTIAEGAQIKQTGHQRTSAFDYDSQRLLGNLSVSNSAIPQVESQSSDIQNAATTPIKPKSQPAPAMTTVGRTTIGHSTASAHAQSTLPSVDESAKPSGRPLTIAIPPPPLVSSNLTVTPTGMTTPLSPTGMPLQGILKNKPRTPTGDVITQQPFGQQLDPRTAARSPTDAPLPSASTGLMKSPSISKINEQQPAGSRPSSFGVGSSASGTRLVGSTLHDQTPKQASFQQKSDGRLFAANRGLSEAIDVKLDKSTLRHLDRSQSITSVCINANAKNASSSSDHNQGAGTSFGDTYRKMSTPVSSNAPALQRPDTIAPPLKELRNKELDELFHTRPLSSNVEHQLPKIMKKEKPWEKSAATPAGSSEKSKRPMEIAKEKRSETKDSSGDKQRSEKEKTKEKEKEKEKEKKEKSSEVSPDKKKMPPKFSSQDVHQRLSSASLDASLIRKDKKLKEKREASIQKDKSDKAVKSDKAPLSTSSKIVSSMKSKYALTKLKKKSRKALDDSDEEKSNKAEGRSSDSDDSSDDGSDDDRRIDKKLAKEWKEALAALAEEPAGLSMYDRVKRRSSASYADPWKQGKSSKASEKSNEAGGSSKSSDKFSLLREKRAKQKLAKIGGSRRASDQNASDSDASEAGDDGHESSRASEDSAQSTDAPESSDDQKKRRMEEEHRRKKSAFKKLQQQKKEKEQRSAQKKMLSNLSGKKPFDKKLRLSIADVFSSEASSGSDDEGKRNKKEKKHVFSALASKDLSDHDEPSERTKLSRDDTKLTSKRSEDSKCNEKGKSSKPSSSMVERKVKQHVDDSGAKRGPGRPPKQVASDSGDAVERPVSKDKKLITKGSQRELEGGKSQRRKDDEDDEERRLKKKRKLEKRVAQDDELRKNYSAGKGIEEKRKATEERAKMASTKRVRTDDSESQPESISTKKRRKLSSPVSSPTSSSSNMSSNPSGNVSNATGLLTKAAMKQVEMPMAISSPSATQPKLLTKAAMKDTKSPREEAPPTTAVIQSLDNADLSADIVEALKRSMEEDKEDEKSTDSRMEANALELSIQEEVIEATEEGEAASAAVSALEKELRETGSMEHFGLAVGNNPLFSSNAVTKEERKEIGGLQRHDEFHRRLSTEDSSRTSKDATDEKTKPLSVEVDNLPTVDADGHQILSEQKSDVSHVDEIIDDVVHGYLEIDADKLIKMSNAANKAAMASGPVSGQLQTVIDTMSIASSSAPTSLQFGCPSDLPTSHANAQHPNSGSGLHSLASYPENVTASQTQEQQLLFQQHQLQQRSAEIGTHFAVSSASRLPDTPTMGRPLNLPTEAASGLQHCRQQQNSISGVGFGQNVANVISQQPPLQFDFQLPSSTDGAFPNVPRAPQVQRLPSVSHPFTPITPSTNQAPLSTPYSQQIPLATATTSNLTPNVPTYAAAAAAQQQYAAFLEMQQKQAAWASANFFQVPNTTTPMPNNDGGAQQTRFPAANVSGVHSSQNALDQGAQLREYLAAEQRQQQSAAIALQHRCAPAGSETNRVPRLLNSYPIVWQGCLALKNDSALVQMHYVSGAQHLIKRSMPEMDEGSQFATLRISQRMRLENQQLEGVHRRMQLPDEHCVLVALPCGQNRAHISEQGTILQNAFINYLTQKQAAGIVNVTPPGSNQTSHVVHIFPPCEFSDHYLVDSASDFLKSIREHGTSYLFVVVTTVVQVM